MWFGCIVINSSDLLRHYNARSAATWRSISATICCHRIKTILGDELNELVNWFRWLNKDPVLFQICLSSAEFNWIRMLMYLNKTFSKNSKAMCTKRKLQLPYHTTVATFSKLYNWISFLIFSFISFFGNNVERVPCSTDGD